MQVLGAQQQLQNGHESIVIMVVIVVIVIVLFGPILSRLGCCSRSSAALIPVLFLVSSWTWTWTWSLSLSRCAVGCVDLSVCLPVWVLYDWIRSLSLVG